MQNSSNLKNELIFDYAAGNSSLSKSLIASTYLFLNSSESSVYNDFENYCGNEFDNISQVKPIKLKPNDCITVDSKKFNTSNSKSKNKINKLLNSLNNLKWKKIFSGFYEYSLKLSKNESAKLIKMDPGARVPLHSHKGKEYILVLEGSFCDEYGEYKKGNLQINDSKIKHTPIACNKEGCICLTVTEKNLVFYGPFSFILNIMTFFKSLTPFSK